MKDVTFLNEIRAHITDSTNHYKDAFLDHIKDQQSELYGNNYSVGLWILYDNNKPVPSKSDLPLMAKYELKIAYDLLRNALKYSEVYLALVPVEITSFSKMHSKHAA